MRFSGSTIPALKPRADRQRDQNGFTLLEILLALSLVGLVLVSMNTFVFSMGELWGRNADLRLFDQHARAVTRYLEHELRAATFPPAGRVGADAITGQEVRPQSGMSENLLTFELPEGSRLFTWPERPLPEVVCSLQVREREGLLLLWHSRLEKRFTEDAPRETVISPLVSSMTYDYYDATFKTWKNEPQLKRDNDNKIVAPQRLRLKFSYGKLERENVIALPSFPEGLPNF
ncbi:MAG: prepilin-type N-terminal cleavage/methylation domain-containing protein [Opitutus sp.]